MMPPELDLSGRVAVVTGGSRGIGRAIAELLAERGADVAINFRERESAANTVVETIGSLGRRAWADACDVSDPKSVERFFAGVVRELEVGEGRAGDEVGAHQPRSAAYAPASATP